MSDAPTRPCDVCGNYDDHPRHVHTLDNGGVQLRHLDCCDEAGCPDGTCGMQLKGAKNARGSDLRTHLTKGSR